jgi:large subunit ribosomal protein L19e
MKLTLQKRLAASILKTSQKNVVFDPERLDEVKEAITKTDIRGLIGDSAIWKKKTPGVSRTRIKKRKAQKRKGLRKGPGKKKGKQFAKTPQKRLWINKIRLQRSFLKELKQKNIITNQSYKELKLKAKGGFFRSKRHIKLYIEEQGMTVKKK